MAGRLDGPLPAIQPELAVIAPSPSSLLRSEWFERLTTCGECPPLDPERRGAAAAEHAPVAEGATSLAHLPSVGDEVDVQGKHLLRRNRRLQNIVGLLRRDLGVDEAQALANPVYVGVDGHCGHTKGKAQDYGRRLRPNPRQLTQPQPWPLPGASPSGMRGPTRRTSPGCPAAPP